MIPSTATATNLRSFQANDLKRLAEVTGNPCVSILLPTHRKGRETQQDPIRLKNLISEATEILEKHGSDDRLLQKLDGLLGDTNFWRHQGNGLAIYSSPDDLDVLQLNHSVDEHVHVGESFLISPLVREYNSQGECFVLTLSWDEATLYRFDGNQLQTIKTDQLPAKFDDLVLPRDPEESLQNTSHRTLGNTGGSSTAMFHGQGEGEDKIEADRRQYLSLVGDEVASAIYNTGLPLLLVATTEVAGHFDSSSQVSIDIALDGSPAQWTEPQLLERIQREFQSVIGADDRDFKERFGTALADGNASNCQHDIAEAATHGRIATLGFCQSKIDRDELNDIVAGTVRHGGDVFRCEAEAMPDDATIAAIYRF